MSRLSRGLFAAVVLFAGFGVIFRGEVRASGVSAATLSPARALLSRVVEIGSRRLPEFQRMFVRPITLQQSSGGAGTQTSTVTVQTDKPDYHPGETVIVTGNGWLPRSVVSLTFDETAIPPFHPDVTLYTTADDSGTIDTSRPDTPNDDYVLEEHDVGVKYLLTAQSMDSASRAAQAQTTFTDSNASADLDQCANAPAPSPSSDGCSAIIGNQNPWVNGNLGANKVVYFEGDSIPYRMRFDNLATGSGSLHTVTIEWDTTKSGTHALDYITPFNRTVATADPCLGVSGCDPLTFTTFAIPADPQVTGAGVTPIAGVFRMYGGTINGVSAYSYPDGTGFSGDKSARITITFTASVANPVLAWGGHISTRADWGANNSALAIPGSPYHTRLIALDGSGGNQDRSISDEAVIFPGSITIIKEATPKGTTSFPFTASPSPLTNFSLVDDGSSSNKQISSNITNFQTYTVNETPVPNGWDLNSISCSVETPNGGSTTISGTSVAINTKEGEKWACTYTNIQRASLTIVKKIVNDNGGTKAVGDFGITTSAGTLTFDSGVPDGPNTLKYTSNKLTDLTLGSKTLHEDVVTGYKEGTWSCDVGTVTSSNAQTGSVTLGAGDDATCTITNDDQAASLTVITRIVNDNGGTKAVGDFGITTSAGALTFGAGVGDGADTLKYTSNTLTGLSGGTAYTLHENTVTGYAAGTWSCDVGTVNNSSAQTGSVTLANGQSATCTITNDDQAASLTVITRIVNDNGGTKAVGDFGITTSAGALTFGAGAADGPNTIKYTATTLTGLSAGSKTLHEDTVSGYTEGTWSCVGAGVVNSSAQTGSVVLGNGESVTCAITNDDQPGTIVIIKNAKPQSGSFSFTATGTGYSNFTLSGDPTNNANKNTQTNLSVGTYRVQESTQLGWILTGIGGSTDPSTLYSCIVTGSGGSTGVGNLNTQTATITLKNGDTVTCTFENTGSGATQNTGNGTTRTQGFWATHLQLANIAWFGGTGFGLAFPGVAGVSVLGDTFLCGRNIDTIGKLMGAFWSDISKKSTGAKRSSLDHARMQLLQQLVAAELNASAFGSVPSSGSFAAWESAYCGSSQTAIQAAQQQAESFNTQGDSGTFTPRTSADSKTARSIANYAYWDTLP